MATILNFPRRDDAITPEHLQQTIAWEEWQSAVIVLSRGNESMVLTAAANFERVNYLVDVAKKAIWEGRFESKEEE